MSYDLYFTGRSSSLSDFSQYFGSRSRYKIDGRQAWYKNEDTGVYFSFEHSDPAERDPESPESNISFNLNLFRPHFFALEAEPEIHALVNKFGFSVFDPQTDGMGDGIYSTNGFLRGWNHGNEFGYKAFLTAEETPPSIFCLPGETLEGIWRWNYTKELVEESEDTFVPRITFMFFEGRLATMAMWPDAIPALVPEVDFLFIPRKDFAKARLFGKKIDRCLVSMSEARPLLSPYATSEFTILAYQLQYLLPPSSIQNFVKRLAALNEPIQAIPADVVLNEELVRKYRKSV